MPEEGLAWLPKETLLTFDEITRLAKIMTQLGVRTIRLTGGEPLLRPRLPDLIRSLTALDIDDLSLTTNATSLERHAHALKDAGLRRVNVSLDSLDRHRFSAITRRDRLQEVLAGISMATAVGLTPVKVNCVVLNEVNDDEVVEFAAFARTTGCEVRFIEWMPLDADHGWRTQDVVPSKQILAQIDAVFPLVAKPGTGSEPSRNYQFVDGTPGGIGVIASVTEPFCDTCNRLRLSADGLLQTCLFASTSTDLRTPLRDGVSDDDLQILISEAVSQKKAGHGIGTPLFVRPSRSMSAIGG